MIQRIQEFEKKNVQEWKINNDRQFDRIHTVVVGDAIAVMRVLGERDS